MTDNRLSTGMAGFVDKELDPGTTWDALVARCAPEAARRGLTSYRTLRYLKGHAKHRAKDNRFHVVEMNDEWVQITRPVA